MSILLFPDAPNTDWISWKKLTKKSAGIDNSHFRWTSERYSDYSANLPSLSISPLNIVQKPFKLVRRSCPKPLHSSLFIQLPPFTGSIKARNTTAFMNRSKQIRDFSKTFHNASCEMIATKLLVKKIRSKKVQKKLKRFPRFYPKFKQKLEGIVGKRLLLGSFFEEEEGFRG